MARDLARVRIRADDETKGAFDSFKRNVTDAYRSVEDFGGAVNHMRGWLGMLGFSRSAGTFAAWTAGTLKAQAALDVSLKIV